MTSKQFQVLLLFLAAVGAGLLLFGRAPAAGKPIVINDTAVPPVPTLAPDRVARGATLYAQNCARCHGANLLLLGLAEAKVEGARITT